MRSSRLELLSARDFVGRIAARSEENFQPILRAILFCGIGQHQQAGFVILILPGLKKAIGSGQGRSISRIRG